MDIFDTLPEAKDDIEMGQPYNTLSDSTYTDKTSHIMASFHENTKLSPITNEVDENIKVLYLSIVAALIKELQEKLTSFAGLLVDGDKIGTIDTLLSSLEFRIELFRETKKRIHGLTVIEPPKTLMTKQINISLEIWIVFLLCMFIIGTIFGVALILMITYLWIK